MIAIEHINHYDKIRVGHYSKCPTVVEEAMHTCPICHSVIEPKGYEINDVVYYQQLRCPCEINAEREKRRQAELAGELRSRYRTAYEWLGERWSDLPLKKKTFTTFDATKQQEAYEVTKMYAASTKGTLILYGSFGTGKTHLLAALVNERATQYEVESLFTTSPNLFNAIQQCISHHEGYDRIIDRAIRAPLLVIDDVDKAKYTEFREEIYFAVIDGRVKRELPTAISTNKLDALADYVGGAVCSRLQIGQIAVEMIGQDYRPLL